MAKEAFPMQSDDAAFRGTNGPLGVQPQQVPSGGIGGTHHVSTPLNPQTALTGGYQSINGDSMPACKGTPYLPGN